MDNTIIMTPEMDTKDPNLKFYRAVYPNYGNGGGEPAGILVNKDFYASLWKENSDYMRSHNIHAWDAGNTTFVFGSHVEDLIKNFNLWTEDEKRVINMSGVGNS